MKFLILYFTITYCIIFILGCNNIESSKQNNPKQIITFSDDIVLDKKVLSFFDNYLNDSTLNDIKNFFLFIYQKNDTTLIDLIVANTYFYSVGGIKPYGLIKYKEKNIFIISNSRVFNIEEDDKLLLLLNDNMQILKDKKNFDTEKHWLLAIDNLTDSAKIVKNENEILSIILGVKIIDSPYKFNIETNKMDTVW